MHKIKVLFMDNLLSYSKLPLIKYVQCYKIRFYLTKLNDLDELIYRVEFLFRVIILGIRFSRLGLSIDLILEYVLERSELDKEHATLVHSDKGESARL